MFEQVVSIIVEQIGCDEAAVTEDASIHDLGGDSLDLVEILMAVEENFGVTVPDEEIPTIKTVSDILNYIEANM